MAKATFCPAIGTRMALFMKIFEQKIDMDVTVSVLVSSS